MAAEPFHRDESVTLYVGDALETLKTLGDGSVQCCVTSPPYWGLRDYGVDGQLGLEGSPAEYVAAMVAVFAEVRRVLADDGTCWLNLGDSYNAYNGNRGPSGSTLEGTDRPDARPKLPSGHGLSAGGLKPKDLVGIPWRVAFALQADGWYLRSDIIWAKPNPMPESVTDRPTKAHEYVFLLSKPPRYFYDADAIAEPAAWERWGDQTVPKHNGTATAVGWIKPKTKQELTGESRPGGRGDTYSGFNERYAATDPIARKTRNTRTVWDIATEPYPDAHFATFPQALARRCILAGCPEWVCGTCGKARERIVQKETAREHGGTRQMGKTPLPVVRAGWRKGGPQTETLGWTDCGHNNYRPGVVLDPFLGSGTVALVARQDRRHAVGIELNPEYAAMAVERCRIWWRKRDPKPSVVEDQMAMSTDELGA